VNFNTSSKSEIMQSNSGFTIIEVMIAIGIFAIGFLAVGSMQINALNTTNSARRITEAMAVAEDRAEQLMATPFYLDDDFNVSPLLTAGAHPAVPDNTPFSAHWTVTDDVPIGPYDPNVFTAAPLTRSKTIRVWATPDNNAGDILAELEFAKFYRMDQ
jgi:prepilin-type N-terminal cleavage/methylation domain-containing protein